MQKPSKVKLDKTDLLIVEELIKDGRASFSSIGQSIGASTDTVSRRYTRLVENCFIKATIQINPKLLGYNAFVDFFIAFLSQNKTKIAIENLSKIPNVSYIAKTSGDYDLQVVALIKEVNEIYTLNEEIMKIPDIGKIETDIRKVALNGRSAPIHIHILN